MKKLFKTICVLVLALSMIMATASTAMAAEYYDPVIYGLGYYTGNLQAERADNYKLVVPASGAVTIYAYSPEEDESSFFEGVDITVYNTRDNMESEGYLYTEGKNKSELTSVHAVFSLNAGEYIVEVKNASSISETSYGIKFDYNFDSSSRARVSSPAKGKIKITAPRGSNVDGFEVRYKMLGQSEWKTKTIEGNKALNTYLKKLKSGKKYQIQTRKYVKDTYDYTYYSNWTKKQTVKVK